MNMINIIHKIKSFIIYILIFISVIVTAGIIIIIFVYIFVNGTGFISFDFIKNLLPSIGNTLFIIVISLAITVPAGLSTAIYLTAYAKQRKIISTVNFAVNCLSGIPSVIFGLFGMILFNKIFNMGYSMFSGGMTLSLMILPFMIRVLSEVFKTVPKALTESSLALGATKFRTILKIIIPSSFSGIVTGIILAAGRISGETAALIFTAGTVNELAFKFNVFNKVFGILNPGRTLSVHMFLTAKESVSIEEAYATAVILIMITLIFNISAECLFKKTKTKHRKEMNT